MKDLTGNTFGEWSVLSEAARDASNRRTWLCSCTCGTIKTVLQGNLTSGKSLRCRACTNKMSDRDKHENNRLYSTWKSMKTRCNNPNTESYKYYGGRGISVCEEWNSFDKFVSDMSPTFKEGLTLERVDNNLGYSVENCEWVTRLVQANNQRSNLSLEYEGEYITEAELARRTGVSRTTIQARRNRGATVEQMIKGFI